MGGLWAHNPHPLDCRGPCFRLCSSGKSNWMKLFRTVLRIFVTMATTVFTVSQAHRNCFLCLGGSPAQPVVPIIYNTVSVMAWVWGCKSIECSLTVTLSFIFVSDVIRLPTKQPCFFLLLGFTMVLRTSGAQAPPRIPKHIVFKVSSITVFTIYYSAYYINLNKMGTVF